MKYILSLFILGVLVNSSEAQCFNNVCQPAQSHNNIQRLRVVEDVNVLQKRVEFDSQYFLGLEGYYDVGNQLQQQRIEQDRDVISKQSQQLDRLLGLLEEIVKQKREGSPTKQKVPTVDLPDTNVEVGPSPNESSKIDISVYKIFKESCFACHGTNSPKAGLQLVGDGWLTDLSLEDRVLAYDHVAGINLKNRGKKLMPLGGPPLSDEDVELVRLWMIDKAEKIKRSVK